MSLYKSIADIGSKFFPKHKLFKYGFNLSPMYQRSTAKITEVSPDLMEIKVKLPLSYKNRNYVNSIFGGSLFSSVDPIPMVQLINLLGDDYVVWDKSAQIFFKRPAKEHVYAEFKVTQEELDDIKTRVKAENEINLEKVTVLKNKSRDKVFCEVHKVIYIADKTYYKSKRRKE